MHDEGARGRILVVEDEEDLRFSLRHNLEFDGYAVEDAAHGREGLEKYHDGDFDLLVLDVVMPELDGLELLKLIRRVDSTTPILMLTAKSTEMDKVMGLEMGADDYLTKPFGLGELLARVKALLRRASVSDTQRDTVPNRLEFGDIVVDFDSMTVTKGGKGVHFSQKEFMLIRYLAEQHDRAIDKKEILDAVWGYQSDATTRTIDTHIARIRRKLGDQADKRIIQTVPTVGYKFSAKLH